MKKIEFLDLGKQPITNNFLDTQNPKNEFFYDLKVVFDEESKLVSLKNFVPPEKMFNEKYAHRASMSKTMQFAYKNLSINLKKNFKSDSVLEIGSNDGVFLKNFNVQKVVGVEPCKNLAEITNALNIKTYDKFWNLKLSKEILKDHGKFDLIYSANTISHIHDLKETISAIENILDKNGIFIIEDPSLLEVLKKNSYDQFYDEHAYVFSAISISNLLKSTNMEIFDIEKLATHGGSNRYYIKKIGGNQPTKESVIKILNEEKEFGVDNLESYKKFSSNVKKSKEDLFKIFEKIKKNKNKVIGYGATYKSSTVLNYCGLNTDFIDFFIDTTENKQGKFTPGTHIPIKKPTQDTMKNIDYAYLGAWNFKNEIFEKEKEFISKGGKFITHVPKPMII